MPLDPYLAERARFLEGIPNFWTNPLSTSALEQWSVDPAPWAMPEGVAVQDSRAPGPHGDVPVRIYRSRVASAGVLVWSHGGGFSFGDLKSLEAHVPSAELCARTGWTVVSVDYRLAVDGIRFPVPLDDVYAAWLWSAAEFGGNGSTAIGGASAGAALSLATTMRARDESAPVPDAVLLAYPFAHFPPVQLDDQLARELGELPEALRVGPLFLEEIVRNYVGRNSDIPVLAAPGGGVMTGLPPVHIVLSELDDLRASGELLHRQIGEAGGVVTSYLAEGMVHGHLDRTPSLPEVDRTLEHFASILRAL